MPAGIRMPKDERCGPGFIVSALPGLLRQANPTTYHSFGCARGRIFAMLKGRLRRRVLRGKSKEEPWSRNRQHKNTAGTNLRCRNKN
jgi:hypothetical protein